MDPKKWGPTFWWFLEWLGTKVDTTIVSMRAHGHVDKSATNIQQQLLKRFTQFVDLLGRQLLPCRTCQDSTKVFLRLLATKNVMKQFQNTAIPTASQWVFQLHNLVNKKLGKPGLTSNEFRDYRSSNEFQNFPMQNLQYIESCILYCLTKWPQRKKLFTQAFSEFLSPLLLELYSLSQFTNATTAQNKGFLAFGSRHAYRHS